MSNTHLIDLRSDTVTKPSAQMREFMAAAEVGDDVYGEDPTINSLEERVAQLFGKDDIRNGLMSRWLKLYNQPYPGGPKKSPS